MGNNKTLFQPEKPETRCKKVESRPRIGEKKIFNIYSLKNPGSRPWDEPLINLG
jgi:hypothetical protein